MPGAANTSKIPKIVTSQAVSFAICCLLFYVLIRGLEVIKVVAKKLKISADLELILAWKMVKLGVGWGV